MHIVLGAKYSMYYAGLQIPAFQIFLSAKNTYLYFKYVVVLTDKDGNFHSYLIDLEIKGFS